MIPMSTGLVQDAGLPPWVANLSAASYTGNSRSVTASAMSLRFSDDGTKMFTLNTGETIEQHVLPTPWSLAGVSGAVSASYPQGNQIEGFCFGNGGTKVYVATAGEDRVYQYSLSTAWDITTGSYDGKFLTVTAQESIVTGCFFKPDGTSFYIAGTGTDSVHQYNLSVAWDISTASYASKSVSVSAQSGNTRDLFINPAGTFLYVFDLFDRVYEYALSTPWDVSTAAYSGASYSPSAQSTFIQGLHFSDTGHKFFLVGNGTNTVYEYEAT